MSCPAARQSLICHMAGHIAQGDCGGRNTGFEAPFEKR